MKVESMNNNAIDEVRQLNTNLEKSQYELVLTKHVNSLLSDSLISMERQSGANTQYPGRECIEISRIPKPVEDNDLRKTLIFLKKYLTKLESMSVQMIQRQIIVLEINVIQLLLAE